MRPLWDEETGTLVIHPLYVLAGTAVAIALWLLGYGACWLAVIFARELGW